MSKHSSSELPIARDCQVRIHFDLALENGTVVESTRDANPLTFVVGDGTLIEGLELVLYGMRVGDRQCVSLEPRDAFGYRDEGNVHTMPRREFGANEELSPGQIIGFTTPSGDEVPGTVQAILEDTVAVDFNHPLAGHQITFDVEVIAVSEPDR